MKKKLFMLISIVLLLTFLIYAEDDPFAGIDFGASSDNSTNNTNITSENISKQADSSTDDLFSLVEKESSSEGDQVLLPEETNSLSTSSTDTAKTSEIDFLFTKSEESTNNVTPVAIPAETPVPQKEQEKQIVKQMPLKKWIIKTIKSEPLTDFIYTKDGNLGLHRKLVDYLKYDIKTTSEQKGFESSNINDNYANTAWIENGKNEGIGETITFNFREITFAPVYEKKFRSIEIKEIRILNGFCKDENTWEKYNRVKRFKILLNDTVKYYVDLHDSKNWQIVKLPVPITIKSGDKIKLEIVDIYPEIRNARVTNTAISEIYLIGGPAGQQVENKYIASHFLTE